MLDRWGSSNLGSGIGALAMALLLALGAPGASAQDGGAALPTIPAQADRMSAPSRAHPQAGEDHPGVFESIGRWLDESARNFREQLRGAKARVDDLNERAAANRREMNERAEEMRKGAAEATIGVVEAVAKLPGARAMSGRERCAIAPNGAPDCIAAAEALCRKHGFTSGKSIDF